jgi:hypothetical protein
MRAKRPTETPGKLVDEIIRIFRESKQPKPVKEEFFRQKPRKKERGSVDKKRKPEFFLQCIRELWAGQKRLGPNTRGYKMLQRRIRLLVIEYNKRLG